MTSPSESKKTNVTLRPDQVKKLKALTAAIPLDGSRLIGELIDDEWNHLPLRLARIAYHCAFFIVNDRWASHEGINSIPNTKFQDASVREKLEWVFSIDQRQVNEFFEQKWRKRYPNQMSTQESFRRDPSTKFYFPLIVPAPLYRNVPDKGSPDGVRVECNWELPKFDDPDAGTKLREILKELTLSTLMQARDKALADQMREEPELGPDSMAQLEKFRGAQPDTQTAVAMFLQFRETGQLPQQEQPKVKGKTTPSTPEPPVIPPVVPMVQASPKREMPTKPVKSPAKPKPSKSAKPARKRQKTSG